MKFRVKLSLFSSTFLTPIPYLGLASIFGLSDLARVVSRKSRFFYILIANCLFLVLLVLIANINNKVKLSYEEMKRLAVLVCSLTTGLYFIAKVNLKGSTSLQRNQAILILALGWLVSSKIFWELPSTSQYVNYSWYKFAGASAFILLSLQLIMVSRFRDSVFAWILLGIALSFISVLNGAKSFALLSLTVVLLRIGLTSELRSKMGLVQNLSFNRFRLFRTILLTVVILVLILFFARNGLLGGRVESLAGQYGSNLSDSFFRARPEFTYSLQILRSLPFFGYGTIADPFNHIHLQLVNSNFLTIQEQHFLLNRILVNGFNLHSWTFDLVARAGFLCFLPLAYYAILLFRSIFSFELISNYPGLTFICTISLVDLFFSPYSWFVSVQIAFSFLAIFLSQQMSKSRDTRRDIGQI